MVPETVTEGTPARVQHEPGTGPITGDVDQAPEPGLLANLRGSIQRSHV